ncbi:MAG: hypothetical protein ACREQX_15555 [Candidatus Binataceae bacterium]
MDFLFDILCSLLIVIYAVQWFCRWLWRQLFPKPKINTASTPAARAQRLLDQTRDFLAHIETEGALPSLSAPNLHLESGEFVILHEGGV